jgi:hypothetical protein
MVAFVGVGSDGVGTNPNTSDPFLPELWIEHEKRIADFLEGYKRGIKGWGVIENSAGTSLKVKNHSNVSDCSVDIQPGECIISGRKFELTTTFNISLPTANGSLNRWDLIVFNASASAPIARIGTASAVPTLPDIESDDIPLGLVKRLAGDDTIEAGDIRDMRIISIRSSPISHIYATDYTPYRDITDEEIFLDSTEYVVPDSTTAQPIGSPYTVSKSDMDHQSDYVKVYVSCDLMSDNLGLTVYAYYSVNGSTYVQFAETAQTTYATFSSAEFEALVNDSIQFGGRGGSTTGKMKNLKVTMTQAKRKYLEVAE